MSNCIELHRIEQLLAPCLTPTFPLVLIFFLAYLQHLWRKPLPTEGSIAVQQKALEQEGGGGRVEERGGGMEGREEEGGRVGKREEGSEGGTKGGNREVEWMSTMTRKKSAELLAPFESSEVLSTLSHMQRRVKTDVAPRGLEGTEHCLISPRHTMAACFVAPGVKVCLALVLPTTTGSTSSK